ncbi:hypothetical protein BO82DRAFT_49807 [Aspergillus uvarum CBS 121591]|uniref:Uncharacterized protein n=1 Tax=Aspergillus uvarum CBS 121591 TaxID=1448315 RepID=A0A319CFD2_9EURO|nr:hypothetical protein BO82DRAFT_49807 [Aspergillus uvarum CBS 121591]PYH83019.1 hypothetical protein BO82DRAFT_49807 [Aspergillus uvarum CBS 121591]
MKGQSLSVRQSWAGCTLPAMLSRLTDWHSPCGLAAVCMGGVVDVRFRRRIWTLYQGAWFVVQTYIVITLCEENGLSGFLLFSSLPLPPLHPFRHGPLRGFSAAGPGTAATGLPKRPPRSQIPRMSKLC